MTADELVRLRQFISNHYSSADIQKLCFDLGVDYDDLRGETHSLKAQELVVWMYNRGRISALVDSLHRTRPKLSDQAGFSAINSQELFSAEAQYFSPSGYLTKETPYFQVSLPLFEKHKFEEYLSRIEKSLRIVFEWESKRVVAAAFVLGELVSNAFEHGCRGRGELLTHILVRVEVDGEILIIRVTSPGDGFSLTEKLRQAENSEQKTGLWLVNKIADELIASSDGLIVQATLSRDPVRTRFLEDMRARGKMVQFAGVQFYILPIIGELTHDTVPAAEEHIFSFVEEVLEQDLCLIVDLSKVPKIASAGARLLVELYRRFRRKRQEIYFVNLTESVSEVLALGGLDAFLPIHNTVEEAMLAAKKRLEN